MIKITNIQKSFDNTQILKGIDLVIERGEVVVILGPSGSGKTTFLRCLNALEIPQKGKIEFLESSKFTIDFELSPSTRDITSLRRKSGMVFQNYNLFPHKTALQNVTEGLLVVHKSDKQSAEKKAMDLIARVGLQEKADLFPYQLSGGQQQRIGIARALALDPELMLFDEPTAALDPELVQEVLSVMRELAMSSQTMIIVTHQVRFARDIADKIIIIENGLIIESGSPDEVLNNPKQERTKKFLNKIN